MFDHCSYSESETLHESFLILGLIFPLSQVQGLDHIPSSIPFESVKLLECTTLICLPYSGRRYIYVPFILTTNTGASRTVHLASYLPPYLS